MVFEHSHQLVDILRSTLQKIENDPSVVSSEEDVAQLRRILIRWIAEAESTAISSQAPAKPAAPSEPIEISSVPKKRALDLAVALIADPPAQPASDPAASPKNWKDDWKDTAA